MKRCILIYHDNEDNQTEMMASIADAIDGEFTYMYGCPSSEVEVQKAACGFPSPSEIMDVITEQE